MTDIDQIYMQRCIELALCAEGATRPNPMVGAVVVHSDRIIGEGFHRCCGQAHAEVNAIAAVRDHALLADSTLYVSLEPCAHWGRTPPCAQLIIDKKIPRVVIGCVDTFSQVAGRGIAMLRDAGVQLRYPVLEDECRWLNRRFFCFHEKKRPFIVLKWAQTLDGFIDLSANRKANSRGIWITDDVAKQLVHKLRTTEDAIMIGTNTALFDNPQLTARLWSGANPLRIVLDRHLRLPQSLLVFDSHVATLVFTEKTMESKPNCEYCTIDFSCDVLPQILGELHKRSVQSLIVEGGRQLLQSFINAGLWDEAQVYVGNKLFYEGTMAPRIDAQPQAIEQVGGAQLLKFVADAKMTK